MGMLPGGTIAPYLTPQEVADLLQVHVTTVLAWCKSGELKAINASEKRGSTKRRWRISREAYQNFENSRSSTPATPPQQTVRRRPLPPVKEYV
jgi:excisionase family DNA binding protein